MGDGPPAARLARPARTILTSLGPRPPPCAAQAVSLQYIRGSIAQSVRLNKPLALEEFGFPRDSGSFSPDATTTRRDRRERNHHRSAGALSQSELR